MVGSLFIILFLLGCGLTTAAIIAAVYFFIRERDMNKPPYD